MAKGNGFDCLLFLTFVDFEEEKDERIAWLD